MSSLLKSSTLHTAKKPVIIFDTQHAHWQHISAVTTIMPKSTSRFLKEQVFTCVVSLGLDFSLVHDQTLNDVTTPFMPR